MIGIAIGLAPPVLAVSGIEWEEAMGVIDSLIKASRAGESLQRSTVLQTLKPEEFDGTAAVGLINAHPDFTSYQLLFALRQTKPALYQELPAAVRAQVLADALAHVRALNDWGYLDPSGSHDGEAARALLALGAAAVAPLVPLLDDDRPAPLFGSEPAAMSSLYRYRRKDFAYRYIALLTGRHPEFDADPRERDAEIAHLAAALRRSGGASVK